MSATKTIQAGIVKLNGNNWYTWSKEVETYLTMDELWDVIDEEQTPPSAAKELTAWTKRDKKAYAHIYFLIEPDSRETIFETKLGSEAWKMLKAEYEKDNPSTRMNLRQQFSSLSHDPSLGVAPFTTKVLSIGRQLEAIGHKPSVDEITDKLLIGLHPSFVTIRTNLSLRKPAPTVKEIIDALKEFEGSEIKKPDTQAVNTNDIFYAGKSASSSSRTGAGGNWREKAVEAFDWGNTLKRDGVCWRCGRSGHVAQNCIADMPEDVKRRITSHRAHFSEEPPPIEALLAHPSTSTEDLITNLANVQAIDTSSPFGHVNCECCHSDSDD